MSSPTRPAGAQLVGLKLKRKLIYGITCHPAHLSFCRKHLLSSKNSNVFCITCLVFFYFSLMFKRILLWPQYTTTKYKTSDSLSEKLTKIIQSIID